MFVGQIEDALQQGDRVKLSSLIGVSASEIGQGWNMPDGPEPGFSVSRQIPARGELIDRKQRVRNDESERRSSVRRTGHGLSTVSTQVLR